MKAILHYRAGPELRRKLADTPPAGWTVAVVDESDVETFEAELADADVLLHVLCPIGRAQMEKAPKLKLIQKIGVGIDTIDTAAAEDLGIGVANMPGTNSQAVAELSIGLMLSVLRQIPMFDAAMRAGTGWSMDPAQLERSGEIAGRTVGFVGFGEVPRRMVPILTGFGAKIIYHDRVEHDGSNATKRSLDEVLAEADILSLHVPLVDDTRDLIRAENIAKMKDGAVLINTARGGLVNEADLFDALESGKLLGAGLDVLNTEPAPADTPLLSLPNVIALPHVAWLTPETITRSLDVAFRNAAIATTGGDLINQIKPVRR